MYNVQTTAGCHAACDIQDNNNTQNMELLSSSANTSSAIPLTGPAVASEPKGLCTTGSNDWSCYLATCLISASLLKAGNLNSAEPTSNIGNLTTGNTPANGGIT